MTNDEGTTQYTYNAANQLILAGDSSYSYDANGNLIKKADGELETQYRYNGANQLTEVQLADESYVKYSYDALGRKIYREEANIPKEELDKQNNSKGQGNSKSQGKGNSNSSKNNKGISNAISNGNGNKNGIYKNKLSEADFDITKTTYQYQGLSTTLHKEYSETGSPYAEYYMGPYNQVVSQKMFGLHGLITPGKEESLKTNGGLMYYQYDGLNTVSELTNRNGDIIERYRYDAFGNILTGITAPYNKVGYTGQEYDDKSGLINMNARWYDPNAGRFMTQDTYMGTLTEPLSQNLYSYVLNNPVNMWDPTGNVPSWVRNRELHYKAISGTPYLTDIWYFQDYSYSSTGLNLISEVKEDRGTYYYYKSTVKRKWKYNHYRVNYDKVTVEETGEVDYIFKSFTKNAVTYRETSIYTHTEYKSAAQQAADNKEVIKNLGEPPENAEPIFTVSTLNDEVIDADILTGFDSEGKGVRKTIIERTIEDVIGTSNIEANKDKNKVTISGLMEQSNNVYPEQGTDYSGYDSLGIGDLLETHDIPDNQTNNNDWSVLIEIVFPGSIERNQKKFDSKYDFANYLLIGIPDDVKDVITEDDPFSANHLLNSFILFLDVITLGEVTTQGGFIKNNLTKIDDILKGMFDDVKIVSSKGTGNLVGSLDGLTSAERRVVDDLLNQGKTVEIIPTTTANKTPDFLINGVKTELKTLQNPNINTGITRIQKGLKQGAEVVIIDAKEAGLSSEQAKEILKRAAGTYNDKIIPGSVEIWTNNGIITYP